MKLSKCKKSIIRVLSELRPRSFLVRFLFSAFGCQKSEDGMTVFPLTPIDNATGLEAYTAAMNEALKDEHVRNIAIAAQYGAGKSTFLRTYFRDRNVLWVSLASFVNTKGKDEEERERRLEASILQQMFYAASGCELPFSHFNRIACIGLYRYVLVTTVLGVVAWAAVSECWLAFAIALIPVVMFLMDLLRRVGWTAGLKFKGVEISMEQKANASIFNRFLDEIIYYFATLRYDAVVFEDIDRCNTTELFVKLRELNLILNNARQIPLSHRPVKFVYAVRDDILEKNEDRVKFFDAIIPIVPVLDPNNAATIFLDQLRKTGRVSAKAWTNCEKLIRQLAPFFKDRRLVNNIINEYSVIRAKLKSAALLDDRLLAMMVFKNYFPVEYDNACRNEGLLPTVFGSFAEIVRKEIVKPTLCEIESLNDRISSMGKVKEKDVNELDRVFFLDGFLAHISKNADVLDISGTNESYTYKQYMTPSIIPKIAGKRVIFKQQCYQMGFLDWSAIEKTVGGEGYEGRKKKIEARINGELANLKRTLGSVELKRRELEKLSLSQIVGRGLLDVGSFKLLMKEHGPRCTDAALLYALLSEGAIAEDYPNYLSQYAGSVDEQGDFEYRVAVMNGKGDGSGFDVKHPQRVIDELAEPYFHSQVILNHSVFKYFVEHACAMSGDVPKAAAFAEVVCSSKEGFLFLSEHLKMAEDDLYRFRVFDELTHNEPNLIDKALGLLAKDRAAGDVVLGVWMRKFCVCNVGVVDLPDRVRNYLIEAPDVHAMFVTMGVTVDTAKLLLEAYALPFKHVDVCRMNKEIADVIIATNSYDINYETLKGVVAYVGGDKDLFERQNLSAVKGCGDARIVQYVFDEQNFLNAYLRGVYEALPESQDEPSDVVCEVVNQPFMTRSACRIFLVKQSGKIEKGEAIKNQHAYEVAFLEDRVKPSWENALELFERCCIGHAQVNNPTFDSEGVKMLAAFLNRNWAVLKSKSLKDDACIDDFKKCVGKGCLRLIPEKMNLELMALLGLKPEHDEIATGSDINET